MVREVRGFIGIYRVNILHAIILGLVEGVTEYLPISSTGHLIITAGLLGLNDTPEQKAQIDAFSIMIQGGAILAVLGVFWPRVVQMLKGLAGRDAAGRKLFFNLVVAFLPAAFLGVLLNDWIEEKLFYAAPVTAALFLGGVLLVVLRKWQRRFFHDDDDSAQPADAHTYVGIEHLTWRRALLIGCLQVFAMWPGTSRSMMTIVGGMVAGMKPRDAAEFSFLLGIPTLGGACAYSAFKNFVVEDSNVFQTLGMTEVIVGAAVAMLTAAVAVKWLIGFLSTHGVAVFGWYRIGLSAVLLALILTGVLAVELPAETVNENEFRQDIVTTANE